MQPPGRGGPGLLVVAELPVATQWKPQLVWARPWSPAADAHFIRRHPSEGFMKPKHLYLGLCVLGVALPYSQFLPFLREHGFDLRLIVEQLFASRISSFFGLDVLV